MAADDGVARRRPEGGEPLRVEAVITLSVMDRPYSTTVRGHFETEASFNAACRAALEKLWQRVTVAQALAVDDLLNGCGPTGYIRMTGILPNGLPYAVNVADAEQRREQVESVLAGAGRREVAQHLHPRSAAVLEEFAAAALNRAAASQSALRQLAERGDIVVAGLPEPGSAEAETRDVAVAVSEVGEVPTRDVLSGRVRALERAFRVGDPSEINTFLRECFGIDDNRHARRRLFRALCDARPHLAKADDPLAYLRTTFKNRKLAEEKRRQATERGDLMIRQVEVGRRQVTGRRLGGNGEAVPLTPAPSAPSEDVQDFIQGLVSSPPLKLLDVALGDDAPAWLRRAFDDATENLPPAHSEYLELRRRGLDYTAAIRALGKPGESAHNAIRQRLLRRLQSLVA